MLTNYSQLIPEKFTNRISFNKKNFIQSLERIAVLADQYNNVIKIHSDIENGCVTLTADAQDVGSGKESLKADISGENLNIAFNVKYLLDGLKVIDSENIILKCNAPTTPAIFSPDNDKNSFVYLVMPVQIRN